MPPREKVPLPVDRPLSKAYLREFGGWSTFAPPGVSDPTTLRVMENCYVTHEGAVAVRPAIRQVFRNDVWFTAPTSDGIVGTFETFFHNDGTKGILFAVRMLVGGQWRVGFWMGKYDSSAKRYDVQQAVGSGPDQFRPRDFSVYDSWHFDADVNYVRYLQINNKVFALADTGDIRMFNVGSTKEIVNTSPVGRAPKPTVRMPTQAWIDGAQTSPPPEATPTADTLISSDASKNIYNFGFFLTFNNEFGEGEASDVTVIRAQRRWSAWRRDATNDSRSADQLWVSPWTVAISPEGQPDGVNIYMFTWSDQDPYPVEAVCIKSISAFSAGSFSVTPGLEVQDASLPLPNASNRYDYSRPGRPSNGLIAADRMILLGDRDDPALIRWSSGRLGEYENFTAAKGGGYKTLTSGNLYIAADVVLWQNPQSVDTLIVLCQGVDGYSTSYYMNPNTVVSGQSDSTVIVGFEETTNTPGTVAPYGNEVLNNALYHPLDNMLMKSTANNYNIKHVSVTDLISNKWLHLRNKKNIVSAQLGSKLFYLVDNPDGESTSERGNEVWVCDTDKENIWSRWLTPGSALRTLEVDGKLYMALVRSTGIFIFDDQKAYDSVMVRDSMAVPKNEYWPITWRFETNTQGANRAHDAWAHLQQMAMTVGNFRGTMRWGIRSYDVNGKVVEIAKTLRDLRDVDLSTRPMPWDYEDKLLVRRDLKEWHFFAESVPDPAYSGVLSRALWSHGQVSLVQYLYTPVTVNVGYEYGSIETFEYTRSIRNDAQRTTDGGIPKPMQDTRYP